MKRALITGANGQDGFLLGEHLLSLGYQVTGLVRTPDRTVPAGVEKRAVPGPPDDWRTLLAAVRPDEIYHLSAESFAGRRESASTALLESNVMVTARILEAVRLEVPEVAVFLAGSGSVFGDPPVTPQDEATPRAATSLYGASKALLHPLADEFRAEGLFVRIGMLYNHESTRRPARFVTRKITQAAARIAAGRQDVLELGNLEVTRDWGHAVDFVRGMHLMLQSRCPEDRVVATGEGHTVREFCEVAFAVAGLDYRPYVRTVPAFWRPAEAIPLVGNARRLCDETGWQPECSFASLVEEMTRFDLKLVAGEAPEVESRP